MIADVLEHLDGDDAFEAALEPQGADVGAQGAQVVEAGGASALADEALLGGGVGDGGQT